MKNMIKSATRLSLLILIAILSVITTYATIQYIPERFTAIFSLFSQVTMIMIGFFTGKSMKESNKQTEVVKEDTKELFFDIEK